MYVDMYNINIGIRDGQTRLNVPSLLLILISTSIVCINVIINMIIMQ